MLVLFSLRSCFVIRLDFDRWVDVYRNLRKIVIIATLIKSCLEVGLEAFKAVLTACILIDFLSDS